MEKTIIKSTQRNLRWLLITGIVLLLITALFALYLTSVNNSYWELRRDAQAKYGKYYLAPRDQVEKINKLDSILRIGEIAVVLPIIAIVFLVFYFLVNKMELNVSEKRIYGKTFMGRQIEIPIEKVSKIGKIPLGGLTINSSSFGSTVFLEATNRDEIYNVITELLVERQQTKKDNNTISQSNADELAKYKDLMDKGIISKEEFDAKKKQLLGL